MHKFGINMSKENKKKRLPNVTLAAMTSVKIKQTIRALLYSMKGIDFGEVVLVSHRKPLFLPQEITYKNIKKLKTIDDFNYNMVYKMHNYIDTDFMLLVHYDGFVVNPGMWRDEFLKYDYIGSPFPPPHIETAYKDINGNICRVGNSVSIRSKRLLEFPEKSNMPWLPSVHGDYNEDCFICCQNKHLFEAAGMQIAPLELAKYFGHERMIPEVKDIKPFVFHKYEGTNAGYRHINKWYKRMSALV